MGAVCNIKEELKQERKTCVQRWFNVSRRKCLECCGGEVGSLSTCQEKDWRPVVVVVLLLLLILLLLLLLLLVLLLLLLLCAFAASGLRGRPPARRSDGGHSREIWSFYLSNIKQFLLHTPRRDEQLCMRRCGAFACVLCTSGQPRYSLEVPRTLPHAERKTNVKAAKYFIIQFLF